VHLKNIAMFIKLLSFRNIMEFDLLSSQKSGLYRISQCIRYMKIALVYSFPFEPRSTQSDSVPIWIWNVANRLVRYHDVVVYSPRGYHQKKVEYFRGVKYRRISAGFDYWLRYVVQGASKRLSGFVQARRKHPYFESIFNEFTYILKVAKDLQTEKCDIVHIHEESRFISIIRALNPRIQIVFHMHSELITQLDYSMIEHRLRKADLILGCSRYITDKIRQSFPSLAGRCETLYNGVDIATFVNDSWKNKKRPKPKEVLFVSKVTPEKGLHVLLESFKEVVERYPSVRLEIVGSLNPWPMGLTIWLSEDSRVQKLASFYRKGSSTYLDYLKHRLVSLNISNNVTFHGRISHEQAVKFYQAADVFVQPSVISEAFGMGIIEAMACQVPVVATKVGGIPEIVENGKTGLLVEPGDSHALANAILELLSHEDLRRKMGKIGWKRVESFSWDNIVTNLVRLYGDMVAR
jgi:glycosyltransferase involved in cell wall biosynthesis